MELLPRICPPRPGPRWYSSSASVAEERISRTEQLERQISHAICRRAWAGETANGRNLSVCRSAVPQAISSLELDEGKDNWASHPFDARPSSIFAESQPGVLFRCETIFSI